MKSKKRVLIEAFIWLLVLTVVFWGLLYMFQSCRPIVTETPVTPPTKIVLTNTPEPPDTDTPVPPTAEPTATHKPTNTTKPTSTPKPTYTPTPETQETTEPVEPVERFCGGYVMTEEGLIYLSYKTDTACTGARFR